MAVYIPTSSIAEFGVQYELGTFELGDVLVLNQGIAVASLNSIAVFATGVFRSDMLIDGTVLSASDDAIVASNCGIMIGETGRVFTNGAGGFSALNLQINVSVTNAGTVQASSAIGAWVYNSGSSISNSGLIEGANGGVLVGLFVFGFSLDNSGTIRAGLTNAADNTFGHGVQISGDLAVVMNSGTILARSFDKAGIHLGDSTPIDLGGGQFEFVRASFTNITNSGDIISLFAWGVDGFDNGDWGFNLTNSGTIQGAAGAVRGTAGDDVLVNDGILQITQGNLVTGFAVDLGLGSNTLVNRGEIFGAVILGSGTYDGRGGTVIGGVFAAGGASTTMLGGTGDETFHGGTAFDLLRGGAGEDSLFGYGGSDSLFGGAGDDVLGGFQGSDFLAGGAGEDTLEGGEGDDLYVLDNAGDVVIETLGGGVDRVQSGVISLSLAAYANVEQVALTGSAALSLFGNERNNILTGNAGANRLDGRGNLDNLAGGAGADTLLGGSGNDTLRGGTEADSLTGGRGADQFLFNTVDEADDDIITDFAAGVDDIVLSAFMAGATFIGAAAFSGNNQVRYTAATGLLEANLKLDFAPEWVMTLTNKPVLTAADFVF